MTRKTAEVREVIGIEWTVPEGGFRWVDGLDKPGSSERGRYLVPARAVGIRNLRPVPLPAGVKESPVAAQARTREDFKPTLFRNFASMPPSEEGILRFANRFGNLGGRSGQAFCVPEASEGSARVLVGEPLGEWEKQIWLMGQAIRLWDAYQGRGKELSDLLTAEEVTVRGHSLTFVGLPRQPVPLDWDRGLQLPVSKRLGPREKAQRLLDHIISRELDEMNFRSAGLRMRAEAKSLRTFMWYQLLRAIAENARHLSCEVCGDWFKPKTARGLVKYCSPGCRMRAYRERKTPGKQVHKPGSSAGKLRGQRKRRNLAK